MTENIAWGTWLNGILAGLVIAQSETFQRWRQAWRPDPWFAEYDPLSWLIVAGLMLVILFVWLPFTDRLDRGR